MKPKETVAITISFLVTSTLGVLFVYWFWSERDMQGVALLRASVYVVVMALVHVVAFRMRASKPLSQSAPTTESEPTNESAVVPAGPSVVFPGYKGAIGAAVVQQAVVLAVTALLLDGGQLFRVCGIGAIAHWCLIAIIIGRRPAAPTRLDLGAVRVGYCPLCVVIASAAPIVHAALGR